MIRSEPVLTTATVAVLLDALVAYLLPHLEVTVRAALVTLLLAIPALVARHFSFSEDTLREANLDPKAVARKARDKTVPRCDA